MAACSGGCGREGAGPYDSGRPEVDGKFTWCDPCWHHLVNKQLPPGLAKDVPAGTWVPFGAPVPVSPRELSAVRGTEHKIMAGGECKSVTTIDAAPVTGSGTFSGYLAGFSRDHGGDTIMGPAAVADTIGAMRRGEITWLLTDSHSAYASDVVAQVRHAAADSHGVRITADWMPTDRAQVLRSMVANGARLGLSIDYTPEASRPDGKGGRYLDRISIYGGAVTPAPMNSAAVITEGKTGTWAPVVGIYEHAYAESQRRDPDRLAEDRLLAAASWPPPGMFDRETSLALIRGAEKAMAARIPASDDGSQARRERYEQANRYSTDLAEWMAAHR